MVCAGHCTNINERQSTPGLGFGKSKTLGGFDL